MAGDTPGRKCPCEDGIWRPRAGGTRPAGVSVGGGDAGLPRAGETLSSPDVAGRSLPVVPAGGSSSVGAANPAGSYGPVVAGGPVGLCGTLSPLFHDALEPLEHSVLDHDGPVGRDVAVGLVGKDETLLGLDRLEHAGLDHADPVGQRAAVGPVGLFGTLSPSDCHPAGPYVAGGPVDADDTFQVLDPLEHSGPDHADLAGQHAVFQDVLEPLEHSVLDTALDGRPMVGFPVLGTIEHSVLEMTLDGRHSEMTIDEVSAFGSECGPGRSAYGGDTHSGTIIAFGSGGVPGQRTLGGDVTFRTVGAFGSECSPRQLL